MPKPNADEILTSKHIRTYIQFGGPRPGNPVLYGGQDAQYLSVEGVGVPESGGVDPVFVPDPSIIGRYRLVGRKISPPDLASATLKLLERHGSVPRQLIGIKCPFNIYQPSGKCKTLSDFLSGWTNYVLIYSYAEVSDKDLGTRTGWEDDNVEDSLSLTLADVYPVGALVFGEAAAQQADREVVDIVYGGGLQCGDCGPQDDGSKHIYAITKSSGAASPGLPSEVIYSLDGGSVWGEAVINGIGASADATFIDIVGDKMIVGVESEGAYYWSTLTDAGVPGTFTKVVTGFVATKNPTDVFVSNPREVYFSARGGYVYKSTDITAGVVAINAASATSNDLLRIHGKDETIVATGTVSTAIVSSNRGVSFSTVAGVISLVPVTVQAVSVLDNRRFWVGTNNGRVYYSSDGGATWTQKSFSGAGAGSVRDIVFPTDEVGYFLHNTSAPAARIFSTWNGGEDWTMTAPRITNLPVFDYAGRIACPNTDVAGVSVNAVAVAGLAGDGVDGIVLIGYASRL